jgi:micrococcal nuclease
MKKLIVPLVLTLVLLFSFMLYNKLTGQSVTESQIPQVKIEKRIVTKIIDGDTIVVSGGETVRLLGMDTDERGYPCYTSAKKRLENLALGKEVTLERGEENKDQYGRLLRYIFLENNNVNVQLVREGMAIARLENNKLYAQEIKDAEAYAIQNKIGCKWSNLSQQ